MEAGDSGRSGGMKEDMDIVSEMVGLLDRFCSGFASGDAAAVAATCDMNPDLIVVTSHAVEHYRQPERSHHRSGTRHFQTGRIQSPRESASRM